MNNNKQSSIEWLYTELTEILCDVEVNPVKAIAIFDRLKQAKAMHLTESVDFALYAMMAESFNDLPEATKNQLREAIEIKYKEFFKL